MGVTVSMRAPRTGPLPIVDDPLLGVDLQGYVVTRALSSGGMGLVYEARHPLIGQRAAVKVLRPELCGDSEFTARFLCEAQTLSAIRHPNIVEILNFGVLPQGGQFILMEFLEGETLAGLIERRGAMDFKRALFICEEILSGLGAAHEAGVVHRDLKPENVILTRQGDGALVIKVLDFGLSQRFDVRARAVAQANPSLRERSSIQGGTPEYISPEQASGRAVNGQADLYSLGVILFEMLTGRLPFEANTTSALLGLHLTAAPPKVGTLVPTIPSAVEEFVDRLLAKDPARRPSSARAARDMVRGLRGLEADVAPAVIPENELAIFEPVEFADTVMHLVPAPPPRARIPMRVLGLAVLLTAIAIFSSALSSSAATVEHASPVVPVASVAAAPPPAPEPPTAEPAAPEPAAPELQPLAPRVMPPLKMQVGPGPRKPSVRARPPAKAPAPTCAPDDQWRRATSLQVEQLEQAALARVASPRDVAAVTQIQLKTRELNIALESAKGAECQLVEAEVRAWQGRLR